MGQNGKDAVAMAAEEVLLSSGIDSATVIKIIVCINGIGILLGVLFISRVVKVVEANRGLITRIDEKTGVIPNILNILNRIDERTRSKT